MNRVIFGDCRDTVCSGTWFYATQHQPPPVYRGAAEKE
jgi:hypothetical protein